MNGKHLVLTLLIGVSLMCSPLSVNELLDDSDPSNDIPGEEAKPVKIENLFRENSDPSKDISTETESMKIENPLKEDSIKTKDTTIDEAKPMIIENPLEVDSDTSEDISIAKSSSMNIEYQIGTVMIGSPDEEFWSDWASDGDLAVATYPGLSAPGIFQMRVIAPGYHVEYQIGFNDQWSTWASDGDVAAVTYSGIPCPGFFQMRIMAPGFHVEYQINFNQYWSQWASDGDVANLNYSGFMCPGELSMRATMSAPGQAIVDIDPDTLNLKSKGKWITCYITLNSPYDVNDIDISTILLEDSIPAEWGDIQGDTLMVKFNRSDVQDMLPVGTYNLKVTGELTDGTEFEGYSDEIRVIDPP